MPEGGRLPSKAPFAHWPTSTLIGSLRSDRVGASRHLLQFNRRQNSRLISKRFLPETEDIGVMDYPDGSKSETVRRAIDGKSPQLPFLPPCCPDPDPTEKVYAKLKCLLQKAKMQDRKKFGEAPIKASPNSILDNAQTDSWPPGVL